MYLASPIIPAATRTVYLRSLCAFVIDSWISSILQFTTNIDTICFFNISWDMLAQEWLDTISSYRLTGISLDSIHIHSIDSFFSFFLSFTTRAHVNLYIFGTSYVENAEEQVDLARLQSHKKPVALRSLVIRCLEYGDVTKSVRAILLSPSSSFNLRALVVAKFNISRIREDSMDSYAILLRDLILSSNLQALRTMRSNFIMPARPSFIFYIPSSTNSHLASSLLRFELSPFSRVQFCGAIQRFESISAPIRRLPRDRQKVPLASVKHDSLELVKVHLQRSGNVPLKVCLDLYSSDKHKVDAISRVLNVSHRWWKLQILGHYHLQCTSFPSLFPALRTSNISVMFWVVWESSTPPCLGKYDWVRSVAPFAPASLSYHTSRASRPL
ncbi:uncharacterized protein BT62DRAFT_1009307 [Guyanagaster necrorhizus]|uniref:Uncharacterized protein n=1 Tax=Guyanagaster necrorhizus TaxID=856835 RepID=A0A9P8APY3_9AGAR|nr:uncharacterized protein BT62DRAFT_1009307 [Guyanagaster necrorhizus MCA 3950]KAG7443494.1 hypothetical protein BT62DRAFT_1009307 [Guyanagaster necrorhizus MCA 3950]